jgi:hypothetical protein
MRSLYPLVLLASLAAIPAFAHHGWGWTDSGEFSLTGTVTSAELGNPHGVLTVEVDGEVWTVEVGQPWRNAQAGLTDEMLAPGAKLTAEGHRSTDPAQLRMKAERLVIDGQSYNLYPDRS